MGRGGSMAAPSAADAAADGSAAAVQRKETPSLRVREQPRLATGAALHWQQLAALTRKNLLIRGRAWKTNLLIVAQAALFIFLIWAVNAAVSASRQRLPAYSSIPDAQPMAVGSIPDCADSMFMMWDQSCYTLLYAPAGDPTVEAVIAAVAANNQPPLPREHLRGFANATEVDAWVLAHPNTVLAAALFWMDTPDGSAALRANMTTSSGISSSSGRTSLGFTIQSNSSVQWFKGRFQDPNTYVQLPLQVAVEREIVRYFAGDSNLGWDVELAQFPHPAAKSPSMIGKFAPTFLFASLMFQFVLVVHDVVQEKESRVRQAMQTMGLKSAPFWASWILFQGFLAVVEACLLVGFSWAFSFRLFTHNAFGLSFLLLLLVSLSMTSLAFLLASLLPKAAAAVPAGFITFIVAWVFLIVIAFGFPYSTKYSTAAVAVWSLFPWSLLAKGVGDLAYAADAGALLGQPGLTWGERYSYCQAGTLSPELLLELNYWYTNCVMPLGQIYWVLAVQCVGFMTLALYFDAVLPDANGVRLPPWFLLQPGYWFPGRGRNLRAATKALAAPSEAEEGAAVDADVQQEQDRMRRRCRAYLHTHSSSSGSSSGGKGSASLRTTPRQREREAAAQVADSLAALEGPEPQPSSQQALPQLASGGGAKGGQEGLDPGSSTDGEGEEERQYAVEMFGLRKTYKRGWLPKNKPFVAVRGNWLGIYQGECFCLLGPNGAGKSTTINCLTGVLPFTQGDALVYGESLASAGGMDRARPIMGVCPQFDVLWDQLTGKEHLLLFAAIKGLPRSTRGEEAERLLEEVRLSEAARVRAGSYSGGMRRRLSVAIALLGDPKVVFLDEPTTGLDPISRRHLWDLIYRAKRDRAIVLTTHSMEEADICGDRIGIMARGRLRCVGTSLRLKARFGSGYRVSIRVAGGSSGGGTSGGNTPAAVAGSPGSVHSMHSSSSSSHGEIQPEPEQAQQLQPAGAQQLVRRDPVAAQQAKRVKALFLSHLGVPAADESLDYCHFLVPYEAEDRLPALFTLLKERADELGVADIQLRLAPLEEVFLNVARKAELEHAQLEGRYETLVLQEEGIAIKVPIGAELIQSPGGHLYQVRWAQDPDCGELRLQQYWRDPVSTAALGASGASTSTLAATAGSSVKSLSSLAEGGGGVAAAV